jgi:hypothetical protein
MQGLNLGRWVPLISVGVLVATQAARLLGYGPQADQADQVARVLNLTADAETVAQVGVLGGAVAGAGVGLFRKLRSLFQDASGW